VPVMPRIARSIPQGSITRPDPPGIPVFATVRWYDGRDTTVPAHATAWTRDAVEITWDAPGIGIRADWIPAGDVRRADNQAKPEPPATATRPPDSRGVRLSGGGMIIRDR
jgi:hypothetical protein